MVMMEVVRKASAITDLDIVRVPVDLWETLELAAEKCSVDPLRIRRSTHLTTDMIIDVDDS